MKYDAKSIFLSAIILSVVTIFQSSSAHALPLDKTTPLYNVVPEDIAAKYIHYRDSYIARHIDRGGTVEALLDDETKSHVVKYYGQGDSQGWTGLTMAAFAFQGDWDLVLTNLSYWPLLVVEPGLYKRFPEHPDDDPDPTSIDQYGEMLMGIAAVWLLGPDDLRNQVADITRDMIAYGKTHDWRMSTGPYTDCNDIKFLYQLLSDKMNLGIDVYAQGENFESIRQSFFDQFKKAVFVRQTPRYYNMNLYFERLFVAKLLKPDLQGLDQAIRDWYKVVAKDGNTMFDWFYSRVMKKDTSFVLEKLRGFPPELPNEWLPNGYNVNYRWERSPEQIAEKASGLPVERSGMDFIALASFYSYFELNDF